jgi:hypothetical protein
MMRTSEAGSRQHCTAAIGPSMMADSSRQADDTPSRSAKAAMTVSIRLAVSALVLTAILLTAAASSLL